MASAILLCTRATAPKNASWLPDQRRASVHRLLLLSLLLGFYTAELSGQSLSQTVIGSTGTYYSVANTGNLHFTVGELVVDRTTNGFVLERGFHQGYQDLLSTAVWLAPEIDLSLRAYPNPSLGPVVLEGSWDPEDRAVIRDLFGRPVQQLVLPPNRAEIDLSPHPAGTYFLTIFRNGRPLGGIRLVRQ